MKDISSGGGIKLTSRKTHPTKIGRDHLVDLKLCTILILKNPVKVRALPSAQNHWINNFKV